MTIQDFADRFLAPYRVRGEEIIPALCPFCHGGEHGDRETFALNTIHGAYVCQRGTCGAKGRIETLMRSMGETIEGTAPAFTSGKSKSYKVPDT